MINNVTAAKGFNAVGSKSRLIVLTELVKVGSKGLTIGEIQKLVKIPLSTLAHHLDHLKKANLINQEQKGRSILNFAEFKHIQQLANYLLKECCVNEKKRK
jgi:DNA-binding transcriptional ArsR family regulator